MKRFLLLLFLVHVVLGHPQESGQRLSECNARRPKVRPNDCCPVANVIPAEALDDCKAEYPDRSEEMKRPGPPGRTNPCVMECYFNATGIFKDGQPVKAMALDILGKGTDAATTSALNDALDKCIKVQADFQSMKERKHERFPGPPPTSDESEGKRCRPTAKFFLKCVQMQMFNNCPADKLNTSEDCVQLKAFAEKCMPPM